MPRLILLMVCALCCTSGALAQEELDAEVVSADSPRAALQRFVENTRKGDYAQAATLLDVPATRAQEAPALARRLKAVLDRRVWIDVETLSASAEGDKDDRLSARFEEIGRISGPDGIAEPVRLVRSYDKDGAHWRFSRSTVGRIDVWYAALPDRWFMERLPQPLLALGPLDLMWWQWLALPLLAFVCAAIGRVLGWLSRKLLSRIAAHTSVHWDKSLVLRARGPLTLFWGITAAYMLLPRLALLPPAQELAHTMLKSGVIVALFWAVLRSIDLASDMISTAESVQSPTARSVLPIASRFAKIAVMAMLVIAVLSNFGLPVASLIAGLGVGGVALALAAQKTVENVFGAVSIGVDRPFRIGDLIKVGDITGNVESIGLRSTRIRTADRTLITLPNGGLADSRVESLAARDRIRLSTLLALEYGTSEAAMRKVLADIETMFRRDQRVLPDSITVQLKELAVYSLNIDVSAALMTQDPAVFTAWRQETLLSIMGIMENAGVRFAFPTRTLRMQAPSAENKADSARST